MTAAQMAAYVYSLASGDLTANGTGTHTLATVNANVGSFGNATQCTTITVNAKGLITGASQTACTPAMSSVTGRATLAQLPQGIANSIWINPTGSTADMQNIAVPACANDGAHALVYVNGSGSPPTPCERTRHRLFSSGPLRKRELFKLTVRRL
jgi:hypothetical protein